MLRAAIKLPANISLKAIRQRVFPHLGNTIVVDGRVHMNMESGIDENAKGASADSVYPDAMAAGFEMGDIIDLMDHDMT